jgi:hypothetical protein
MDERDNFASSVYRPNIVRILCEAPKYVIVYISILIRRSYVHVFT